MRWLCPARAARLAAAAFSLVTIAGCPELNQWSGPSQDPFFCVPDLTTPGASQGVSPQATTRSDAAEAHHVTAGAAIEED
ncbi:MAG: hypothetical protein EXS05_21915 [Planctomycetaceae bacterium]|nr:hypothetical protein [Planctomycetaceae bacterium]